MLNEELHEPRRPGPGDRLNDAPRRLRQLSDVAKAAAVARGVASAVGYEFVAEVESVRYCSFGRTFEFRRPTEIRVLVRALEGHDFAGLQGVPEAELEWAIAQSLSVAADEDYRVRVVDKNYGPCQAPVGAVRLTLVVGTA